MSELRIYAVTVSATKSISLQSGGSSIKIITATYSCKAKDAADAESAALEGFKTKNPGYDDYSAYSCEVPQDWYTLKG